MKETKHAVECTFDEYLSEKDKAKIDSFDELMKRPDWDLQHESKKSDFKVFFRPEEGSPIMMCKGECTISASVDEVMRFIATPMLLVKHAMIIDIMFKEGRVVEETDPKHVVILGRFKMPPTITHREVLYESLVTKLDAKTGVILGSSVEREDCPIEPDSLMMSHVRCNLMTSGYHLKETEDGKTFLTYCVHVDPRGWVPAMIVNLTAKDQANNVKRIKQHFDGKKSTIDDDTT